jgi:hypothetical protein
MPDLNRSQNFVDGDLVTALKLKNLIDLTTIDPTFVSSKVDYVYTAVDGANDTVLLHDLSSSLLRKVKVRELLKVPTTIPVLDATLGTIATLKTSVIDGQTNKGMLLTPFDGVTATNKSWVSSNGNLVTVTATAHGLTTGAVLAITASNASYSADTPITVTSVDAFTYTLPSSVSNVAWTSSVIVSTPPAYNQALVTVTSTAHGLTSGTSVTVTASDPNYSAASASITVLNANQFTYTLSTFPPSRPVSSGVLSYTPARIASAGTLSYTQKGYAVVNGRLKAVGKTELAETKVSGDLSVTGNASIDGTSRFTGATSFAAPATFYGDVKVRGIDIKPRLDYFVQTRTQVEYQSLWGGAQNPANPYGTKLALVDITFTPQKAGNKVVLEWSLFGEGYNGSADMVFLVTRTPNTGAGAGVPVALPDAVDAANNTWSGVTTCGYDNNDATTPSTITVKIVDFNSLDVSCTYSVFVRPSNNTLARWFFNRSCNALGQASHESGMSLGHAQEIYT